MRQRVCIIESNNEIGKIFCEILDDVYETVHCSSIAAFSTLLNEDIEFDLVITEIDLVDGPWMDTSYLQRVPVLVVTGHHDFDSLYHLMQDWADDYLMKPISNDVFKTKCRYLISGTGLFECDAVGMTVCRRGMRSEELTANEFRLLALLSSSVDHKIAVVKARDAIWGPKVSDQRIHTMLSRLRPKLRGLKLQLEMSKEDSIVLSDLAR